MTNTRTVLAADSPMERGIAGEDALAGIVQTLRLHAGIFTDARYCGTWAVDTSGDKMATFHVIQEGDCWLLTEGMSARQLMPGDFVFFPRDARHLISSRSELPPDLVINQPPESKTSARVDGTRMLCGYFEFRSQARWPLLDALPEVVVLSGADCQGTSRMVIDLILAECAGRRAGYRVALQQLSYLLFIEVLREALGQSTHQTGVLRALSHPQIGAALGLMHEAPERPWRLPQLAARVGMSRSAFAAAFREEVGQSVGQYLLAWRMQVAVDLLATTDRPMAAIAEAVGYGSEAAFRNAFSKHVGTPPARVRRQARQSADLLSPTVSDSQALV
ncbi:MAG: AraC family transcriptional regulator [Pseudomonadota bacterium]